MACVASTSVEAVMTRKLQVNKAINRKLGQVTESCLSITVDVITITLLNKVRIWLSSNLTNFVLLKVG